MEPSELVVISGYFNPCRYERRRANHARFCRALADQGVLHLTLECAFDNQPFDLPESIDVLQVRAGAKVFQTERLYNLLASWLPDTCKYVAWVDCDVLFQNPRWAKDTVRVLQDYPVAQLFEKCHRLPADGDTQAASTVASLAAVMRDTRAAVPEVSLAHHGHTGYAWAMRRELFDSIGLYEGAIVGGADHFMGHAFFGDFGHCVEAAIGTAPRQIAHLKAWGIPMFEEIQGQLGVVPGDVIHLWHGAEENRRYLEQIQTLCQLDYDPAADIIAPFGRPLEWSRVFDKPAISDFMSGYFYRRAEDRVS